MGQMHHSTERIHIIQFSNHKKERNDLGKRPQFFLEVGVGGVEILHEAEEREFIEEDLRQVDKQVFTTLGHPGHTHT